MKNSQIPKSVSLRYFIPLMLAAVSSCGASQTQQTNDPAPEPVAIPEPVSTSHQLTLPVEVLGDGNPATPLVKDVALSLDSTGLATADKLWFQCHHCGSYGAPEYEHTDGPVSNVIASVRVLGGMDDSADIPWVDVTDANLEVEDTVKVQGGINGGFYTVNMALILDSAMRQRLVASPALNRVQFRFNGTDGESNGFRILNIEMTDANNEKVSTDEITRVDPQLERSADNINKDDADAGKALWYGKDLLTKSSIVNRTIHASCSSCHAEDGWDLQYFNYSNNAIVQRSRFHGLSAEQGQQIADFLRYSLTQVPYVDKARPWNPPYQPGPGLDCDDPQCAVGWSAGAGLEAVAASPAAAAAALFGKNALAEITQNDVDQVMDANATLNVREMPVPMQFPDWNAWLPQVHPLDVWPVATNTEGAFDGGAQFVNGHWDPKGRYQGLIDWLTAHQNATNPADWSQLSALEREQIMAMFTQFGWESYSFLGGGRGDHIAPYSQYGAQVGAANLSSRIDANTIAGKPANAFGTNAFIERAMGSLLHWNSVRQWDLAQHYHLEGNQQWFIGEVDPATGQWKGRGEAHGWPFNTPSVFYLAPHMLYQADKDSAGNFTREWYQAWEANNLMGSYYRSNQWYQLQMTINPGAQSGWVNFPMDWPYLTFFDELAANTVGSATPAAKAAQQEHNIRLLQGRIKSAQYVNNDIVLYDPSQSDLIANQGRYGRAQVAKHLAVNNFIDSDSEFGHAGSPFAFLDELTPGLYLKVVNGAINQFNSLYADTKAEDWRRCDPNNTQLGESEPIAGFRYCLDSARTPLGVRSDGSRYMHTTSYGITTEQIEQYGLWRATAMGADPVRLGIWQGWIDAMWPAPAAQ
ncbi:hypothetical protein [Gallaecimonas pentaromativorans]|uniref:hypothetical protein n=1 Tax=Gallaecimonas pentaromativorans TaxID=584787 RepID=UPI003A94EF32